MFFFLGFMVFLFSTELGGKEQVVFIFDLIVKSINIIGIVSNNII